MLLSLPHLQGERTLAGLRHEHVGVEVKADPLGQAQPAQAGGCQQDGVGLAGVELAEPGVDIAPQRHGPQVGAKHGQQRRPAGG